ncbi:MAG: hypothetical protein JWS12_493 [Candidatus Saccharibacteria bacterium]|nr:hypothetical protein [Candidatus Saccharibacteria bacterium]
MMTMAFNFEHDTSLWQGNSHVVKEASRILCLASIEWGDGNIYQCEREDPHDGEERMHGANVADEWTNWADSYLEANPQYDSKS